MKQVSILFDALRSEKFAIAVKDDYNVKYYGSDGQGQEWASWANSIETKSFDSAELPAGIIQGPYKNMSENAIRVIIGEFGYEDFAADVIGLTSKGYQYKNSIRFDSNSRVPAVADTPISHFTKDQFLSVVNYKGLTMREQIKAGSFIHEAKVNNYAFNYEKSMYVVPASRPEVKSLRARIDNHVGRSSERRIGQKLKTALTQRSGRHQIGAALSLETKSMDSNLEIKSIGRRIGGAGRIGRRAARGVFARFDPNAWDGDGDGIVQEGTPFERPAIPGVNDRATGGNVDAAAATAAWEKMGIRTGSSPKEKLKGRKEVLQKRRVERRLERAKNTPVRQSKPIDSAADDDLPPVDEPSKWETAYGTVDQPQSWEEGLDTEDWAEDFYRRNPIRGERGMRSRISDARSERQARGLASRRSKAKKKSKQAAKPGVDKVEETDGQIWESLSDEQKQKVKDNADRAHKDLKDLIKSDRLVPGWWADFLSKNDEMGKKSQIDPETGEKWSWGSNITGEALVSLSDAVDDIVDEIDDRIKTLKKGDSNGVVSEDDLKEIKRLETGRLQLMRAVDDIKTLNAMRSRDDYSLLEHLHPATRSSIVSPTKKKREGGWKEIFDGKKPKDIDLKKESSIFGLAGGKKKAKSLIGEKADKKLQEFAKEVFRKGEERRANRRAKKMRKGGTTLLPGEGGKIKPESQTKKRIRKAKRAVKRKIGRVRNGKKIEEDIQLTRDANRRIFVQNDDGSILVDFETVARMAELESDYKPSERMDKESGKPVGVNADSFLAQMWDQQGYTAMPTVVSEEEVQGLLDAGWTPIQRGHGLIDKKPGTGETTAIFYYSNRDRFITGEGGTAAGPGEYWAHPENVSWDSWIFTGSENAGTLGLVPPSARILTQSQAGQLKADGDRTARIISGYIKGAGSGGKVEDLDPAELAREIGAEIRKNIPDGDPWWDTEIGKMVDALLKFAATADAADKGEVFGAFKLFGKMITAHPNFWAMLMGYDGVDLGKSDGRFHWFNRGGLAVVGSPLPLDKIKSLAKGD